MGEFVRACVGETIPLVPLYHPRALLRQGLIPGPLPGGVPLILLHLSWPALPQRA
jgi:hypothetical protein